MSVNVLHLISSLEIGGAERLLISLLESAHTETRFNSVVLIVNSRVNEDLKESLLKTDVPCYLFNRQQSHKHPRYLFDMLKIIRHHNIQVIHTHDYGSKFWASLCKLIMPHLKIIYTIHDTNTVKHWNGFQRWLHRHWLSENLTISKSVTQNCIDAFIDNYRQIENGIDLSAFESKAPSDDGQSSHPLRIINVARFEYETKGQDILLQALAQCKQAGLRFHCTLAGTVQQHAEDSYQHIQNLVQVLNLSNEVSFVVDQTDVPALLREHELFILPSRHEGFGLAMIEAMAAGLPVIASAIDTPKELIEHGINGFLFESENPDALADVLLAASTLFRADQSEALDRMTAQGLNTARRYDIRRMVSQYAECYQSLLTPWHPVMVVGSDYRDQGGIGAVFAMYQSLGFFRDKHYLISHRKGSLLTRFKTFAAFMGAYCSHLIFNRQLKIIHAHTSERGSLLRKGLVLLLAKAFGKKVIFHMHGAEFVVCYERSPWFIRKLIRSTLERCDLIIALSESWKRDLQALIQNPNVTVVYNPAVVPDVYRGYPATGQGIRFLMLGNIGQRKGIYDLIEAAKAIQVPHLSIDCYGDGEVEQARAQASEAGVDSFLHIHGWISGADKQRVLNEAHVLLLPSYNEGLPVAILEALAIGLPVLSTTVGGIPEAIEDGVNGFLIPPGDVNALSEKIVTMSESPELLKQMSEAAYQTAVTHFAWPKIFSQLTHLYQQLILHDRYIPPIQLPPDTTHEDISS